MKSYLANIILLLLAAGIALPAHPQSVQELDSLRRHYYETSQYNKAIEATDKLKDVIKSTAKKGDYTPVEIEYFNISLLLIQRRWDDAHRAIPEFIQELSKCDLDKYKIDIHQGVYVLIQQFEKHGLIKECVYIDNLAAKRLKRYTAGYYFTRTLDRCINSMNQGLLGEAESSLLVLKEIVKYEPNDAFHNKEIVVKYMECYLLVLKDKIDEAKNLYLTIQNEDIPIIIRNNHGAKAVLFSIQMSMGIVMADYERAAIASDSLVVTLGKVIGNSSYDISDLTSKQAALNALAGKYDKAKRISSDAIAYRRKLISENTLGSDTTNLNQTMMLFDWYIEDAKNLNDSAKYVLRDIKSEYLNLKVDMMRSLPLYQLTPNYYKSVHDLALWLVRMHKYPEAQDVMNKWFSEWKIAVNDIEDSNNAELQKVRHVGMSLLDSALNFCCHFCYDYRDSARFAKLEDWLEYIKNTTDDGENSRQYRDVKISYLKVYKKDYVGLKDYIESYLLSDTLNILPKDYESIAIAYKECGDRDSANEFWKKYVRMRVSQLNSDYDDLFFANGAIDEIIDYYCRYKKDSLGLLNYYDNELWQLIRLDDFSSFISSILRLRFRVRDDSFIPFVIRRYERFSDSLITPEKEACLNAAIALVLSSSGFSYKYANQALEYINRGSQFVINDKILTLLFGCYCHNIAYGLGLYKEYRESNIKLGYTLLSLGKQVEHFKDTQQYVDLIERQIDMLSKEGRHEEVVELGEEYLKSNSYADRKQRVKLFNVTHPLYNSIGFINDIILEAPNIVGMDGVRKCVYKANASLGSDISDKLPEQGLAIIHDEYKYLATSMSLNSVSAKQCNNLISLTSKLAGRFSSDSLRMYAYDAALLCKGLQLRSTNAIHAIIRRSGHKGALRKFEELQAVLRELPAAKGGAQDSLVTRRDELERDLHRLSSSFGDYKRQLYTSWRDVQAAMAPGDLAVEFTHAASSYSDPESLGYKYGYYACVLGPKMSAPQIIFLAETDSITTDVDNYTSPALSQLLLTKLKPYLKGVKNLYYSPIGAFSQISLESLPLPEAPDKTLASKFNLYRLSSTREIIRNGLDIEGSGAVVYGGLRYDTSVEQMANDARKYNRDISLDQIVSLTNDDLSDLRGHVRTIQPLPGTQEEAESIVSVLNSAADTTLRATPMIGDVGTEASFKSLGGRQKRVIHLSTHGFYFSQREFDQISARDEERTRLNNEDKTLKRSGLFLAGAANKYEGREIPAGVDDGILTSQEIAGIDLTGLDLCVLSACQTAQGDITSEGVMGLQRGFKKAGAKSILMSLWKVDDEATCHMMKEFYRHWIADGKTKYQALEMAKQSVRARTDKGWDDPHFWAAFILLDAPD